MTMPSAPIPAFRAAVTASCILAASVGASSRAPAQDLFEDAAPKTAPPAEITAFVKRLAGCNRWAGEEATDAERGAAIAQARFRLRCNTIAQDEGRLRARFATSPGALEALDNAGSSED